MNESRFSVLKFTPEQKLRWGKIRGDGGKLGHEQDGGIFRVVRKGSVFSCKSLKTLKKKLLF